MTPTPDQTPTTPPPAAAPDQDTATAPYDQGTRASEPILDDGYPADFPRQ